MNTIPTNPSKTDTKGINRDKLSALKEIDLRYARLLRFKAES
jgi:hypothetical protein